MAKTIPSLGTRAPATEPQAPIRVIAAGKAKLVPVDVVAEAFSISGSAAIHALNSLRVPVLYVGRNKYYLESAFEEALLCALEIGQPCVATPSSDGRNHPPVGIELVRQVEEASVTPERRAAAIVKADTKSKQSAAAMAKVMTAGLKAAAKKKKKKRGK